MIYQGSNDTLPSMIGIEEDSIGAGEHIWRSPSYILSDRALNDKEHIHAWAVRESDGRIMSRISFTASEPNHRDMAKWPAEFLRAINSVIIPEESSRRLLAGNLADNGALEVYPTGSPTSYHFSRMSSTEKTQVNRFWHYDNGCRAFTSAPFIANQVAALPIPETKLTADESAAIQVRDRTSLRLYETHLFTPQSNNTPTKNWSKILCQQVNDKNTHPEDSYGMLRAGVLDTLEINISPMETGNALWIPQNSDLSVELDTVTWQNHGSLQQFTANLDEVIQIFVYDRYSDTQLPGSPFRYTITDTDSATCLAALTEALRTSALGRYVKMGEDNQTLWVIGLPIRVVTLGLPGISSAHAQALETLEGKPLSLGELYDDYKEGVTIRLSDRWNGDTVISRSFQPEDTSKATKDAWVIALCNFLKANLTPDVPFVWFGESTAQPAVPTDTDVQIGRWTLWLPPETGMVLTAEPSMAITVEKRAEPLPLSTQITFRRDTLVCEEILTIGIVKGFTGNSENRSFPEEAYFDKLLSWGDTSISATDYEKPVKLYADLKDNILQDDDNRKDLLHSIFLNSLPRNISLNPIFGTTLPSSNVSALSASRLSRIDAPSQEADIWDLGLPVPFWIEDCVTCSKKSMTLKILNANTLNNNIITLLSTLRKLSKLHTLLSQQLKLVNLHKKLITGEIIDSLLLERTQRTEFQIENTASNISREIKSLHKLSITNMSEAEKLISLDLLKNLGITEAIATTSAPPPLEIIKQTCDLLIVLRDFLKDSKDPRREALVETIKHLDTFESINLDQTLKILIKISDPSRLTLTLKLSPEASNLGIQFAFYQSSSTEEILNHRNAVAENNDNRNDRYGTSKHRVNNGLYLHIPANVAIPQDLSIASASYISEAGIVAAAPTALTINPPFTGKAFTPADSLCADYANTLGSEVYDVTGATENGVDPRTGLFHAHYPIGVIRGLAGKGPEIDLRLHYSATRANEGGQGDGWALRFSSYDNRLHRLTLSNGQTVTLSSDHITGAKGTNSLRINGISLSNAQGTFEELAQLTVTFPSGRREVLTEPQIFDRREPSENYKKAFSNKLDKIKENLEQWLKEAGMSRNDIDGIDKQLKEVAKLKSDINRKALILVPSIITSPLGGTLTLEWTGKEGHIQLNAIKDGSITLLTATHEAPVATGKYESTFRVWPDTGEEYSVKLEIQDCLLTTLTRKGKNDAAPTQTVVFGYCGEPVLDRVLNSVAEEDGSLEVVSYASTWKTWDTESSSLIPLSRVARHTLVPGAGQPAISHTWQWRGINNLAQEDGSTFTSTQTLDNGDDLGGPFTRRTWTLKNGYPVLTETIEETPAYSRTTTQMEYPDEVQGSSITAQYRWATQPIKTTVTTEGLQVAPVTTEESQS
ncbi:hypothetical protein OOJ96_15080 [Pseudomonas sp. 15FMM2]|uniref:Uncharacterized protein n=1 Tax=Pseudomonas imrae TaxID=2992837 RepID=A0ACC7PIS5_9PSED